VTEPGDYAPTFDWTTIQRLFVHSQHGVQIADRTGQIVYANRACAHLMDGDALHRPLTAPLAEALAEALAGQDQHIREVTLTGPAGDVLAEAHLTPLADTHGTIVGAAIQYTSLGPLQAVVLRLAEDKARLDAAIASVQEGVLLFDPEGRVLTANACAHAFYGIAPRRLLGLPRIELATMLAEAFGDQAALATAFPLDLHHDPEEERALEYALIRPVPRVVRQIAAPVYDEVGIFLGQIVLIHDITAERAALRARDELLSVASHELRTPITAIKGFAQLLQRDMASAAALVPRAPRHLAAMLSQTERLARLVDELLDVSRIETGRLEIHRESCDLAVVLREVAERLTAEATRKGQRIVLHSPPGGIWGEWDPGLLDQIVTNLLDNAFRFSLPGGMIHLHLTLEDAQARLGVEDEGIGIPPDQLAAIFEPFTRAENAQQRQIDGFGLGLYIVRRIVERHNGQIWAESIEGRGSTFWVLLPRQEAR
jgi:signal transduction histidine kinase